MKNTLKILILVMSGIFFFSCSEGDDPQIVAQETLIDLDEPVVQYIMSLGVSAEDIYDYGDFYLAQDDIMFRKDMKFPHESLQTEQYRSKMDLVSPSNRRIQVVIDKNSFSLTEAEVNDGLVDLSLYLDSALEVAIMEYDQLAANIHIKFSTESGDNVITILRPQKQYPDDNGKLRTLCGVGSWPNNGYPGKEIFILPTNKNESINKLATTIVHELAHCIGIRHTGVEGDDEAKHIEGTPRKDDFSIMNANACGRSSSAFSENDILALNCLYGITKDSRCDPLDNADIVSPDDEEPNDGDIKVDETFYVCVVPKDPTGIQISSYNQGYIYANVISNRNSRRPAGYNWQVSGGIISSGDGTDRITIIPNRSCHIARTLSISVRAFNISQDNQKCYSQGNATGSTSYQTNCRGLF